MTLILKTASLQSQLFRFHRTVLNLLFYYQNKKLNSENTYTILKYGSVM